jgi:hypothetical protein
MDAHGIMALAFGSIGVVLIAMLARSTVEQRWFLPLGIVLLVASMAAFVAYPRLVAAMNWTETESVDQTYAILSDLPDLGVMLIGAWVLNRFVLRR